jgi:hypothetical protein
MMQAHFNELHSQKVIRDMVITGKVKTRKKRHKEGKVDLRYVDAYRYCA